MQSQRGLSESDYNALEMLLFEYKNVRSWMEKLTIYLNQHSSYDALATGNIGELVTVYPIIKYVANAELKQYHGAGAVIGEFITVYPHAITESSSVWNNRITSALYTAETITIYPKIVESIQTKEQYRINVAVITAEDITTFPN